MIILTTMDGKKTMSSTAHALRPVRIVREELRNFTGTTFPRNPYEGCELIFRRMEVFGMIEVNRNADQWVDVLDVNGDIIREVPVTPRGFKYLRRVLGSRLEAN